LCDHSQKRDDRQEHSPGRYYLYAAGDKIAVQIGVRDQHPQSAEYVCPDELDILYTASGFGSLGPPNLQSVRSELLRQK